MSEDHREPSYGVSQLRMEAPSTKSEDEPRSITEQEFRTIGLELRATKCHILDGVPECIPEHMKVKARCICDILKRLDLFFVNRHHEIIFEGDKLKGSNIHNLIEEILLCCPRENIQPTRHDSMTNSTNCTLETHVPRITQRESETDESRMPKKRMPKSRNPPRITRFVSLFDGKNNKDVDTETDSEEEGCDDEDPDDDTAEEETCSEEDDDEPTKKRKKT